MKARRAPASRSQCTVSDIAASGLPASSVSGSLDDSQSKLSRLVSGLSLREARRLVVLLTAVTTSLDRGAHPDAGTNAGTDAGPDTGPTA